MRRGERGGGGDEGGGEEGVLRNANFSAVHEEQMLIRIEIERQKVKRRRVTLACNHVDW